MAYTNIIYGNACKNDDTIQFIVATETAGNVFSVVEFGRKYALIALSSMRIRVGKWESRVLKIMLVGSGHLSA